MNKKKFLIFSLILALVIIVGISAAASRVFGLLPQNSAAPSLEAAQTSYTVACVGDSLTFGMGTIDPATESYPSVLAALTGNNVFTTENYGFSGATVDDESTNAFAPPYAQTQSGKDSVHTTADIILLMLGTNDAVWSPKQPDFYDDFKLLLNTYISLPQTPKVIVLLPPHLPGQNMKGYADALAGFVEQEKSVITELKLDSIDVYTFSADMSQYSKDGVHFTAEGYKLIAGYVYEQLSAILAK